MGWVPADREGLSSGLRLALLPQCIAWAVVPWYLGVPSCWLAMGWARGCGLWGGPGAASYGVRPGLQAVGWALCCRLWGGPGTVSCGVGPVLVAVGWAQLVAVGWAWGCGFSPTQDRPPLAWRPLPTSGHHKAGLHSGGVRSKTKVDVKGR